MRRWGEGIVRGNLKWILAGVAIAAVAAPTGAVMAANSPLTAISNLAGTKTAGVSAASQLLASESDPKNAVIASNVTTAGESIALYTVPAKKALVMKTALLNTFFQSGDTSSEVSLIVVPKNPDFQYYASDVWFSESAGLRQSDQVDFGSQVVAPSGATVYLISFGASSGANAYLYGYLVPSSAAPPLPATARVPVSAAVRKAIANARS